MTDVPEHLLRRSRERREALGLGGGGDAGGGSADSGGAATPAVASAAAPAGTATEAAVPAAPVILEPEPVAPPRPSPPRTRVPAWVVPVLAGLPVWAFFYVGALGERESGPKAVSGAAVYQKAGCGGCHGAAGEGGVGPALAKGESKLTFPDEADHISWVENGSAASKGKPYGARGAVATGGMPPFKGTLSPEEIKAVVTYEREGL